MLLWNVYEIYNNIRVSVIVLILVIGCIQQNLTKDLVPTFDWQFGWNNQQDEWRDKACLGRSLADSMESRMEMSSAYISY